MARHPKEKFISARIKQTSAFLELPGEVRTLIYRAAVIKPTPLDLWPHKFITDNTADTKLSDRLKKKHGNANWQMIQVRNQHDLKYLREEMAVGLLGTCQQVSREAMLLFWQENTFRFSGDFQWIGLRRFLTTIGPEARSRIKSLEIAPAGWTPQYLKLTSEDRPDRWMGENSKNHPKMRMAKTLPFELRKASSSTQRTIDNVRFVCEMLRQEAVLRELRIVITEGWSLSQLVDPRNDPAVWNRDTFLDDFQRLKFANRTVMLEKGATLVGRTNCAILNGYGINVIAMPESKVFPQTGWTAGLIVQDPSDSAAEVVTELTRWDATGSEEYIEGMEELFEEDERLEVAARGGKASKTSGRKKTGRVLKGFGGCRFIRRCGFYCVDCKQEIVDPWKNFSKHKSYCGKCKGHFGYIWKDAVEVRKVTRERRRNEE